MSKEISTTPDVAVRLLEERERLGYSQTAFAELVGSTKQTQINWEKGKGAPDANALAIWATVGVDIGYVVTGEHLEKVVITDPADKLAFLRDGAVPGTPEREMKLIENYRQCREPQRVVLDVTAASFAQMSPVESLSPPPPRAAARTVKRHK